jgi:hypothetical protein
MGLMARLRHGVSPDRKVSELQENLERVRGIRLPLYQNNDRIGQVFQQRLPNVREVLAGGGLSIEISGGVPGILVGKGGKTRSASRTIEITPLLQALLLEETEAELDKLVDLSISAPREERLLRFVGAGRIFAPNQDVGELAEPELSLGARDAQAIEAVRKEQQRRMRSIGESNTGTAVWIGRGSVLLASIASMRYLDVGNFRSYMDRPPFGVLGLFEGKAGDAALLSPLLIWRDMAINEAGARGTVFD